ncbi:FtsW/RodA/SpoVE family cell cycle protein [Opitutus terrae]|uniref:FtsW/RodA/SpoVE family cell cycle protein n=1 Tax=Opitutus terrae TaxID=107709 RepID=UPI001ED93284|nr:putative peptidoglycan glycosyltransferase FtsW [Opitutus terrae]
MAVIFICALGLTFLGLTILFSASVAFKQGPYFYLTKQLVGVGTAAVFCLVVSRLDLDYLRRYAWIIAGVFLVLLVLVLIPHVGVWRGGARRWLGIGSAVVQVSEFAKLAMVFALSHYLALHQTRIGEFKLGFVYPVALIGVFALLVQQEPDFGTAALIMAVGLVLLFLAGARWRYIMPAILAVAGLFTVAVMLNPNRLRRFLAFLDVEGNKQGGTYQLYQSLAAFAAGGVDGAGLGQGRQQLNFLPEAHTDMIFAVVGEELGLWFTLGVVALFLIIFVAGLLHLRRAPNLFQYLLVTGCLLLICLQAIINVGVVTGVLPTKGMSLPFISAGLSNLLLMGLILGIFLNTQRTWGRAALNSRARTMQEVLA